MSKAPSIVLDEVEFFPSPDGGYVITWRKDGNRRRDTVSEVVGFMFMAIINAIPKLLPFEKESQKLEPPSKTIQPRRRIKHERP